LAKLKVQSSASCLTLSDVRLLFDEVKMPVLSKDVKRLFKKLIISKDFPLNTSFGSGPKVDDWITIECKVLVGKVRAKISVRLFKVDRPEQVISICWPVKVQTQGVIRKESGQATALPP
jgi:hypothetical protein